MSKFFLSISCIFCLGVFCFAQTPQPTPPINTGNGIGSGNGKGSEILRPPIPKADEVSSLRVLSKPRANYTNMARNNITEGVVRLRITFLETGEIGAISPVSGLPDGLTEQAIAAARSIKFEPQRKNGIPISTVKIVEYSFSIYFNENDKELAQNAEIIEIPKPEISREESEMQNLGGTLKRIKLTVALVPNGTARIAQIDPNLPKEIVQKLSAAVAKIKFNPAIHQNGKQVTQVKEIEYEFSEINN